jgi:hypothetical protein
LRGRQVYLTVHWCFLEEALSLLPRAKEVRERIFRV